MKWECKIEKIENGYIVSYSEDIGDSELVERKVVFEEEAEESEICNIASMLAFVAEYFGTSYSKHNKENLIIKSSLELDDGE